MDEYLLISNSDQSSMHVYKMDWQANIKLK